MQQHVIERLAALLRGGDGDLEVLADAILADVFVEDAAGAGPLRIARPRRRARAVTRRSFIVASSRNACFNVRSKLAVRRRVFDRGFRRLFRREADDTPGSRAPRARRRAAAAARSRRAPAAAASVARSGSRSVQLEDDPLGRFLADAGNRGEPRDVACARSARIELVRLDAREHRQRELRARCR